MMNSYDVFPDKSISASGPVSKAFLDLGIRSFRDACRYVHELPYGYNSNRSDLMILFLEKKGSCMTKHAVVATLARESDLPIHKHIGIYAMTEEIVSGAKDLTDRFRLPSIPMLHCFLQYRDFRVDLTEGNQNGKNRAIDDFLHTEQVAPDISAKEEYLLYRNAVKDEILKRSGFNGVEIKRILQAREEGIKLLKSRISTE